MWKRKNRPALKAQREAFVLRLPTATDKPNPFLEHHNSMVDLNMAGRSMTMEQATVSDIATLTGLHQNTIRRYADRGIIKSKRDFRGWRFFPEPAKTVQRIKALLNGDIELEKQFHRC